MKDPYEILGVPRDADTDQLKKAYRRRARALHPDSDPENPRAGEGFKELWAAYDLLSDPVKRARYDGGHIDAGGARRKRRRPRTASRHGVKNPFEGFFRQRAAKEDAGARGANASPTLTVDFLEAAGGVTKRVTMTNGRRLDVHVPAGTDDGQTLRLRGQGMPGIGGGPAGDAHVEIRIRPHPVFARRGADIHVEVPVTLQEAVLGGKIEVPTIDGPVWVTVPEDSNTGTTLRLKGKGLAPTGKGRGDQYVRLTVMLPDKPNKALTAFVKRWHAYEVRRTENLSE